VVNGKPQWDGAANVKIGQIEFAENFKVLLDAWNMKTNVWLRECVYKRVTPKGKKPGNASSMITFMTSAIWVSRTSGSEGDSKNLIFLSSTEFQAAIILVSFWQDSSQRLQDSCDRTSGHSLPLAPSTLRLNDSMM
jgi:hypothetical protein